MAKGSVRKKGKKWYARFYIEDESGRKVQKEFVGTKSRSETEALLRKAITDYEEKKFVAKSENITVGMLLDLWVEEELKPGNLSNGTVMSYQGTINRIKQHPIGNRKLKTVTADHLQAYIDFLSFGGTNPDGTTAKALSKGYLRLFSAVLQGAFRFAVFPKRVITFNPMQYVVWRGKKEEYELFSDEDGETASTPTLSYEQYQRLEDFHFHMLRHTYTSNLLSNGAAPKDVQELLGHADVSTTMNIYAHATREAKRTSARLLDKVIGGE